MTFPEISLVLACTWTLCKEAKQEWTQRNTEQEQARIKDERATTNQERLGTLQIEVEQQACHTKAWRVVHPPWHCQQCLCYLSINTTSNHPI